MRLVCRVGAWSLILLMAACAAVLSAPSAGKAPEPVRGQTGSPEVVVLMEAVFSGANHVAITYSGVKAKSVVDADLRRLAADTGWQIRDVKYGSEKEGEDGTEAMTTVEFGTPNIVTFGSGELPVEPVIGALREYRHINILFIMPPDFTYAGVQDFENRYVNISFDAQRGNYAFVVTVKDPDFKNLNLRPPETQGGVPTERTRRVPWGFVILALVLAVAAAVAAYLAVDALVKRKSHRRH